MLPALEVISFDCYSALIDAAGGAAAYLYALARGCGEGQPPPGFELAQRFDELQAQAKERFRGYDDVLRGALDALASERRWRLEKSDEESLIQAMCSWQPYPEVRLALHALRAQNIGLALVADSTQRIMRHTLRQLDWSFDAVALSEECSAFGAAPQAFLVREMEVEPEQMLYVAGGSFSASRAANDLGCKTAWLNRNASAPTSDLEPDYEWRTLWELIEEATSRTSL